jgi:Tfp pilus assembly protein PilV
MRRRRTASSIHLLTTKRVSNRRGVALIYAMIALLLASVIGAALLRTSLTQRQQARREQNRLQSDWLVESGVERAVATLVSDNKYEGETWNIDATELGGSRVGQVVIKVAAVKAEPNRRQITVTADFPAGTQQRSRSGKTIEVDLKQLTPQENSK